MVVKKSQGGNKTSRGAQKHVPTPKKNVAEDDLELDEDDDEDLEFEDDSELDEADEELDDDEGSVEQELGEGVNEEEEQIAPSPKGQREMPQKTPTKRKAEESATSPAKRARLEDYIPAEQVFDYRERDKRTLCLTNFHESVKFEEVEKLCKGAVNVHGRKKSPLSAVFAVYQTPEDARAAIGALEKTKLYGTALKAEFRVDVDKNEGLLFRENIIDVRNFPKGFKRDQVGPLFPGARIMKWLGRFARLSFKNRKALVNAIKNPKCHMVGDTKLQFSYGFVRVKKIKDAEAEDEKVPDIPKVKSSQTTPAGKRPKRQRKPKAKTPGKEASVTKAPSTSPTGKKVPTTPAGKKVPTTPAGKKAPTTPAGKKVPTTPSGKKVPTTPGGKAVPATPVGKGRKSPKAKTPEKRGPATKTPSPSKSPKTFKNVSPAKSPLPKQKFQTPKQSPKGTPKGGKSTGKKQKA
ncbi:muscle M-line assembly protein unc-89-like [Ornithodoros turicata]|uniref:muscle M-line assembly protein unc-89-like n=1 Tax=Ornithodoros turicata TaxID=34597 RepID=UPI0031395E38